MCTEKQCSRCKQTKDLSEFNLAGRNPKHKSTWSKYKSFCKQCTCEINKEQKEKYPHHWIVTRYGITKEAALEWYIKSMQTCDICGVSWNPEDPKLCIDHDHNNGKIRGILCKHCNHVLGHARDSEQILQTAIEYLRRAG